jgi:2-polyprenyl-6-methoxyphenol hydroxylase-like FAD-dependent oxidoreductase
MMLGYLLARQGVPVTVLEKHGDFLRDFRGDTVHPSTLEVLYELGLLDDFLKLPHQRVGSVGGIIGDFSFRGPDFRCLPTRAKFVALMPQWDFLDFLAGRARQFPSFDLRMRHEAVDLLFDGDRVAGVVARSPDGSPVEIHALVIGCDGRHSITRAAGRFDLTQFGVPIDVLWFRIGRKPNDPEDVLGNVNYGKMLILINRGDYFQAGLIIRKGSFDEIKGAGLEAFRESIRQIAPYLGDRVAEIHDWSQVSLLTVRIDRLKRWYREGLLCIGDSAHAMSPVGGVGINLAIQDAVCAANLLARPLQLGSVTERDLAAVQNRREFPARVTQAVQVRVHKAFERVFFNPGPAQAPASLKLAVRIPGVRHALGYAVGIGARPEHVAGARPESPRKHSVALVAAGAALGFAAGLLFGARLRASR